VKRILSKQQTKKNNVNDRNNKKATPHNSHNSYSSHQTPPGDYRGGIAALDAERAEILAGIRGTV